MKFLVSLVLLEVFTSSCEGSSYDHDESLLLQITAGIQKRRSTAMNTQHRQFHIKEEHVELLEIHRDGNTVYTICAINNEGNGLDSNDGYVTMETCGTMVIYDENYKPLGSVQGCLPEDVSEGSCFMFTETADWVNSLSSNVVGNLFRFDLIDAPKTPQVILVEVPDMDVIQIAEAENQLRMENENSPGVGILLYGSGAKSLRSRLGYGGMWATNIDLSGMADWMPTWEWVDDQLVWTMPTTTPPPPPPPQFEWSDNPYDPSQLNRPLTRDEFRDYVTFVDPRDVILMRDSIWRWAWMNEINLVDTPTGYYSLYLNLEDWSECWTPPGFEPRPNLNCGQSR